MGLTRGDEDIREVAKIDGLYVVPSGAGPSSWTSHSSGMDKPTIIGLLFFSQTTAYARLFRSLLVVNLT
jgi:hypothetical protein